MARATGANAKLYAKLEAAYGDPATGDYAQLPFITCDLGAEHWLQRASQFAFTKAAWRAGCRALPGASASVPRAAVPPHGYAPVAAHRPGTAHESAIWSGPVALWAPSTGFPV